MPQLKKAVVITNNEGIPVLCVGIEEMTSSEFVKTVNECQKNLKDILAKKKEEKDALLERIEKLEKDNRILKGE